MKYIILLGDGMADYPIDYLKGKTPLEYARTPHMDWIAVNGTVGLIDTIPEGLAPGSDVANLSVLGYDPVKYHTGRGPLEAASMGVTLEPSDVAFRCNLVTLSSEKPTIINDFTSGHITSQESKVIIKDLNRELGASLVNFYSGVGYRHLMVLRGGCPVLTTTPPHDIIGEEIDKYLPKGERADDIIELMNRSREILKDHPVNRKRISDGKNPANSIWLWGEGRAPEINPLRERYGIEGGVISAVDLLKGIGYYAGLEVLDVEGATGYTDTNYAGKAERAIAYLENNDFIFLHVEAPDEMGHEGNTEGKIKSIEDFDKKVVGRVLKAMKKAVNFRIAVLSDHPTPVSVRTHVSDPSPFAVYSSVEGENLMNCRFFGERSAKNGHVMISPGHSFMEYFVNDWREFIERKGD
ncbi:MAG: cofactor-independent phosphoglycerate mutase [Thermodesulfobacteriota bacterium]|nr:cofactor-independent phosphoglycerate mutase [Thermodesulfobacteriota bacterium]